MINIHLLFWQRLRSNCKFQYSILKMVMDWVVALYIIIPGLALFLHTYRGWWLEPPSLFYILPLESLWLIFVIFCWSGILRVYVEEGDQLFLYQYTSWHRGLVVYSILYNILSNLIFTLILAFLVAPFLHGFHGTSFEAFQWLFLNVFLVRVIASLIRQILHHRFEGWRYLLAQVPFLAFFTWILVQALQLLDTPESYPILSLVLFALLIFLIIYRTTLKRTLLKDIFLAQTDKMKFANVLLMYSGNYAKKPIRLRKRPWLFGKSGKIFRNRTPEKILTEMGLKGFLRHRSNFFLYFQVIGLYGLFLSIIPTPWQWILWGVSIFILSSLVKLYWLEWIKSPFVSLFNIDKDSKIEAGGQFIFYLITPGIFILGLIATLTTQEWLLGLLIPAGIYIGRSTAKRMAI